MGIDLDPGRGDIEPVAVRYPPGRHQQHIGLGRPGTGGGGQVEADPFAGRGHPLDGGAQPQVEAFGITRRESLPDVEVVA
jgi:hypothetical protein